MPQHGMRGPRLKWSQWHIAPNATCSTTWRLGEPTVSWLLEVDISIAEGPTGDHVSAHSDGEYRPSRAKFLVEHGLGNVWVQVSHIEGRHWIAGRARIHASLRVLSGYADL